MQFTSESSHQGAGSLECLFTISSPPCVRVTLGTLTALQWVPPDTGIVSQANSGIGQASESRAQALNHQAMPLKLMTFESLSMTPA